MVSSLPWTRRTGCGSGGTCCNAASLWVAAGNSRAIGFYRRFGFEPDAAQDVLPDWENLPEIRMVRPAQRFQ